MLAHRQSAGGAQKMYLLISGGMLVLSKQSFQTVVLGPAPQKQ